MGPEDVGRAALDAELRELGVRTLFVNTGSDFAPLVEAYVKGGPAAATYPVSVVAGHRTWGPGRRTAPIS